MATVIGLFRWADDRPQRSTTGALSPGSIAASLLVALVLLVTGAFFFRRTERNFADVI